MWYIYITKRTAIKKNKIMPFSAIWMQPEIIILSEISQKENDNDITYMWNFKYDTNEPICETETESQTKRTDLRLPRERGLGEGWRGKLGLADVSFYNIKQINKVLLHNTENCIQYFVIGHNEKEYTKKNVHILSYFVV